MEKDKIALPDFGLSDKEYEKLLRTLWKGIGKPEHINFYAGSQFFFLQF